MTTDSPLYTDGVLQALHDLQQAHDRLRETFDRFMADLDAREEAAR